MAAHENGAIRLLMPDEVRHREGAAGMVEQLIAGARAGEVGDWGVGVVHLVRQQEGERCLVGQPGHQAAQGCMLDADREAAAQDPGQLAAE
ncbi:hypothetical protein D3C77_550030 [compost metagenome]